MQSTKSQNIHSFSQCSFKKVICTDSKCKHSKSGFQELWKSKNSVASGYYIEFPITIWKQSIQLLLQLITIFVYIKESGLYENVFFKLNFVNSLADQ